MLRQRAQEKDEQVAQLAQDKEALRNKLVQLNCLVQRLVGQGHHPQINGYGGSRFRLAYARRFFHPVDVRVGTSIADLRNQYVYRMTITHGGGDF
ncbi:hypothetical protein J6590_047345 [Homalodisca vitripennis]|nr:hypothetical protein J6590_047345 [Homalodisca vitripennis]